MLITSRQFFLRMSRSPKVSMDLDFLILYLEKEKRIPFSWAQRHDFHKVAIFEIPSSGRFYISFSSRLLPNKQSSIKYCQEKRKLQVI